jgi:hypothetical protein
MRVKFSDQEHTGLTYLFQSYKDALAKLQVQVCPIHILSHPDERQLHE